MLISFKMFRIKVFKHPREINNVFSQLTFVVLFKILTLYPNENIFQWKSSYLKSEYIILPFALWNLWLGDMLYALFLRLLHFWYRIFKGEMSF